MKQKIKKRENEQMQGVLCEVVDVFLKNGISDNNAIAKICLKLNSNKLRGVKRSITLKKNKLKDELKSQLKQRKNQQQIFYSMD
jgi:hypothetical protein